MTLFAAKVAKAVKAVAGRAIKRLSAVVRKVAPGGGTRAFARSRGSSGAAKISLEEAAEHASRQGIDMRAIELIHEPGSPGYYGFTGSIAGKPVRGATGRFQVTLTDEALMSGEQAVNTIAHELHHIREVLRTGRSWPPPAEPPARLAGDLAELFYR